MNETQNERLSKLDKKLADKVSYLFQITADQAAALRKLIHAGYPRGYWGMYALESAMYEYCVLRWHRGLAGASRDEAHQDALAHARCKFAEIASAPAPDPRPDNYASRYRWQYGRSAWEG